MIIVIVLAGFIFIGSAYSADIDVQSVDNNLTQTNQENINEFTADSSILTDDISRNGASSAISDENDKVNDLKAGEITVYNEDQLQKAVDNESISYIKLGTTIVLTKHIVVSRDSVTIKGLDWSFPNLFTSFSINNINFTQADFGGAILWKGANGKLIDCVFDGCTATNYGGAICSEYGLNLTHCAFSKCIAGVFGGAIYLNKSSSVLNDCLFIQCNVSDFTYEFRGGAGGAVYVSSLAQVEIYGSHFEQCHVIITNPEDEFAYGSGALELNSENLHSKVYNSTFVCCSATEGGAIIAYNALISNCTFDENSAVSGGAIVAFRKSKIEIIDCNFKNNYVRATTTKIGTGGAIYLLSDYCNITNCNFWNNSADMGDSIYLYPLKDSSPFIFISNCTFDENKNEDIIYMGPGYLVYFNNNDLKSGYILNNGSSIKSSTLLGGESKTVTPGSTVDMAANLFDDTGLNGKLNPIIDISDNKVYVNLDDKSYQGTFNDNKYIFIIDTKDIPCGEYKLGAKSNMYSDLKSNMTLTIYSIKVQIRVNIPYFNYGSVIRGSFNFTGHTGNATLNVNGVTYKTRFDTNGNFVIDKILPVGYYANDEFTFITDDRAYYGSDITSFKVNKVNATFTVTVTNITYGDNFTIIVSNVTGVNGEKLNATVPVMINGNSYKVTVNNGYGSKTFDDRLNVGNYTAIGILASHNYETSYNYTDFIVSNASGSFVITVEDILYGDDFTIEITDAVGVNGEKLSGTVVAIINGVSYDVVIINGAGSRVVDTILPVGKYDVNATLTVPNYNPILNTTTFTVSKIPSFNISVDNITYGDNFTIVVSNASDVDGEKLSGTVVAIINGVPYDVVIINGAGSRVVDTILPVGKYDVNATLTVSDYGTVYSNTSFSVGNATGSFKISVKDITYGDNFTINVTDAVGVDGEKLSGTVVAIINGVPYDVVIINGAGSRVVDTILPVGKYGVNATLTVPNYSSIINSTDFTVSNATGSFNISVENITYGNNFTIVVSNATGVNGEKLSGTVVATVNGTEYTIDVVNGYGTYTVSKILSAGDYTVNATLITPDYNPMYSNCTFTVDWEYAFINVSVENITYGNTINGSFNFTGHVGDCALIINGTVYNTTFDTNGKFTINEILPAGNYDVIFGFVTDDGNYKGVNITSFTISNATGSFNIHVEPVTYGDSFTIEITDAVGVNGEKLSGTVVVIINGTPYEVPISSGSGSKTFTDRLSVGEYLVNATLTVPNYGPINNSTKFSVSNATGSFNVSVDNITYSNSFTIVVSNATGVNGELLNGTAVATVNGTEYTINVVNGYGTYTVSKILSADDYTVNATLTVPNYNIMHSNCTFTVTGEYVFINVSVENITYGNTISGSFNFTGHVGDCALIINGTAYNTTFGPDGKFTINEILPVGNYEAIFGFITYDGNYKGANITNFTISNATGSFKISIENITYGDNFTINITDAFGVNGELLNGTVKVIINGTFNYTHYEYTYYVPIISGSGYITVTDRLNATNYDVSASLTVPNYNPISNSIKFSVSNATCSFVVSVDNITYGDNFTINVTDAVGVNGEKLSGIVSVFIHGSYHDVAISNGAGSKYCEQSLDVGDYLVKATLKVPNYNHINNVSIFNVAQKEVWVNLTISDTNYGEQIPGHINYTSNGTANILLVGPYSGNLTVNFNSTGDFIIESSLPVGNYSAILWFETRNHNQIIYGFDTFEVTKSEASFNITINNTIYGNNFTINVTNVTGGNEALNGTVVVTINGKDYNVTIENGKGSLVVTDILPVNNYPINATLINPNYKAVNNTNFNVTNATGSFNIHVSNITYGDNFTINVTDAIGVNDEQLNGTVVVLINGTEFNVTVVNGSGSASYYKWLPIGKYDVSASLTVPNYNPISNSTKFSVSNATGSFNIHVSDIAYGDNFTINVTDAIGVNDEHLNGTVVVLINGTEFNVTVINGSGSASYYKWLPIGKYDVSASLTVPNYNPINNSTSFNVTNANCTFNVTVAPVTYGDNFTINVTAVGVLGEDLNGTAVVVINGNTYEVTVTDGKGSKVGIILPAGTYAVSANFTADNYNVAKNSTSFNVGNATGSFNIHVSDIVYGNNFTINVTDAIGVNDEHLNGTVVVLINGTEFNVTVINGSGNASYSSLPVGKYDVNASLTVPNYNTIINSTSFNITNATGSLNVSINTTTYGNNFTIIVNVTGVNDELLNGTTYVTINGTTYNVTVTNGSGSLIVDKILDTGNYPYNASFTVPNYNPMHYNDTFIVIWNYVYINVTINNITYGSPIIGSFESMDDDFNLTNKTGNIGLYLNGEWYNTTFENGSFIINELTVPVGTYDVLFGFIDNGGNNLGFNITNFTIANATGSFNIHVEPVTYGDNFTINVTNAVGVNDELLNGTVVVLINGTEFNVTVINGSGSASYYKWLPVGDYDVNASLIVPNYYPMNSSCSFNVGNATGSFVVSVDDITYGDNFTINVTNVIGVNDEKLNGTAIVMINGKKYDVKVTNGEGSLIVKDVLPADNYDVLASLTVPNYNPMEYNTSFTVERSDVIISIEDNIKGTAGSKVKVTVQVCDLKGNALKEGVVTIELNGKKYTGFVHNGIAIVEVTLPSAGTYTAKVYYNTDNTNYNNASAEFEIESTVAPNPINNGLNSIGMSNTGNPLLVLLFALCLVGIESLRRKF